MLLLAAVGKSRRMFDHLVDCYRVADVAFGQLVGGDRLQPNLCAGEAQKAARHLRKLRLPEPGNEAEAGKSDEPRSCLQILSPTSSGAQVDAESSECFHVVLIGLGGMGTIDLEKIWRLASNEATRILENHGTQVPEFPSLCPLSLDELLVEKFDPKVAIGTLAAAIYPANKPQV